MDQFYFGDLAESWVRIKPALTNIDEAAAKLGVKSDWLYRRHRRQPVEVPRGRLLHNSELRMRST